MMPVFFVNQVRFFVTNDLLTYLEQNIRPEILSQMTAQERASIFAPRSQQPVSGFPFSWPQIMILDFFVNHYQAAGYSRYLQPEIRPEILRQMTAEERAFALGPMFRPPSPETLLQVEPRKLRRRKEILDMMQKTQVGASTFL